jgi:SAM-dependent methyltransferase
MTTRQARNEPEGVERRRARIASFLPLLASPADGSALRLAEDAALVDASGNRYPLLPGDVPMLIPGLPELLRGHFEACRQVAPDSAQLNRTASEVRQWLRGGPFTVYLFGLTLEIFAAEEVQRDEAPVAAETATIPGALIEGDDGQPYLACSDALLRLKDLRLTHGGMVLDDYSALRERIVLEPPFLLTAEPYPDMLFSLLFEVVLFLDRSRYEAVVRPPAGGKNSWQTEEDVRLLVCVRPGLREGIDQMAVCNTDYFRGLIDAYDLDVAERGSLDIGCGAGFLSQALVMAGARRVVGTDLRFASLSNLLPPGGQEPQPLYCGADMFRWCYGEGQFALICNRNNSAYAKAKSLDGPFVQLGRDMARSLAPNGLIYLSFLTSRSGVGSPTGFTNLTLADLWDHIGECGLHWLNLMTLGTYNAMLLCRPEDREAMQERCRRFAMNQRVRALGDYLTTESPGSNVLRNMFLAFSDFACQMRMAMLRRGVSRYLLWGDNLLSYYVWRLAYVFFPHIQCAGIVSCPPEPPLSAMRRVLGRLRLRNRPPAIREGKPLVVNREWFPLARYTPEQAGEMPESRLFHAEVLSPWRRPLAPRGLSPLRFADPGELRVARWGERSRPWRYVFASGDHDSSLPASIAEAYLEGDLGAMSAGDSQ